MKMRSVRLQVCITFLKRIFLYRLWLGADKSLPGLYKIHEQVIPFVMARDGLAAKRLWNLLTDTQLSECQVASAYMKMLMSVVQRTPANEGHIRVLGHIQNNVQLSSQSKKAIKELIAGLKDGTADYYEWIFHSGTKAVSEQPELSYLNPYPQGLLNSIREYCLRGCSR